ncbi:MAG: TIGR02757 family protein [Candidatus Riflebacteria bacterium]|nr:TIGR02757 family protein [Candidatus Riflebacteria bacterium]
MISKELFQKLENIRTSINLEEEIDHDPIFFPRLFMQKKASKEEIEAIALFSASLSYGKVDLFMRVIQNILEQCDYKFLKLITREIEINKWPAYRLSTSDEIRTFAYSIGNIIKNDIGINKSFIKGFSRNKSVQEGFISLRNALISGISENKITRGLSHLMPDPEKGGAQKRWSMFLRWLARPNDGLDLGLWNVPEPAYLVIPVDRHIGKICRSLGLTKRTSDDWKTALEITESLKSISPDDPLKYDFSLCHLGISKKCDHGKSSDKCISCELKNFCIL